MRIGCLQFAPQVGDVSNNLNRADAILNKADPMEVDNLDLLVLPEMAFSGYNFKSLQDITPYLEPSGSGISALWARTTALKYDCTVAVGYPEDASRRRPSATPEYYNSLIVVNGDGETKANYRKSYLYYTDETWAREGDGFFAGEIEEFGQVAMGICMDINPYKFESPWHAFEFAFHVLEVHANLVILSMAWLTREDRETFTPFSQEPDMETITYWIQRLEPIIRAEKEEEIIVVFCNRCGIEDDVVYAGTSAVLGIKNGEVSVYGLLGRGVKELLVVNTDLPPFAKLVNRPEPTAAEEDEIFSPASEQRSEFLPSATPVSAPSSTPASVPVSPIATRSNPDSVPPSARAPPEPKPSTKTSPADVTAEEKRKLWTESRAKAAAPLADRSPTSSSKESHSIEKPDGRSERDPCESYDGCEGNCGGCDEHASTGLAEALQTPTCPSPTPMSLRPKLAISTGPESLPPPSTSRPPAGMQPGNFFTSRDLCTPPITPFDDFPMSTTRYHRNLPSAVPASAQMYTPEEPVWPVFEGSTKIDFNRTPARALPPRPPSRATEVKAPETKLIDDEIPESNAPPRTESPGLRNSSKTRTREQASPASSSRSGGSETTRHRKRAKSLSEPHVPTVHELMSEPTSHNDEKADRAERLEESNPTKTAWASGFKHSIPIAASPSVFQTTFPRSSPVVDQQAFSQNRPQPASGEAIQRSSSRGSRGVRSKSASNSIPMFQYQPPPIPQTPMISSFSASRGSTRGRSQSKQQQQQKEQEHDRQDARNASHKTTSSMSGSSVHPDIQALLMTEDEALLGRTLSRTGSRGRKRTPKRRSSFGAGGEGGQGEAEVFDVRSPVSI
ncbi:carbon-nitrogen hydrolase [Cercophora scortea]|uniref:Carbon-nitrogen hydrolase n=1 Tax=Cercophora scortea TaxID=314031 RepID=A0AAE0MD43_9PEZI|nr:carbon-nitrogen hydrolase [Cercophora scortea]